MLFPWKSTKQVKKREKEEQEKKEQNKPSIACRLYLLQKSHPVCPTVCVLCLLPSFSALSVFVRYATKSMWFWEDQLRSQPRRFSSGSDLLDSEVARRLMTDWGRTLPGNTRERQREGGRERERGREREGKKEGEKEIQRGREGEKKKEREGKRKRERDGGVQ